ncbi:hypothetical protein TSUD_291120 [Trifolium subterraneum]|uniref:Uncharacterized protein n=1 Tax=Trifolium subterraneum TaxID=3900 RepID=A0A2Z6P5R9_TRISU|nr:hypothetical protein TSUD_291120 [Trifolium subterraneum]
MFANTTTSISKDLIIKNILFNENLFGSFMIVLEPSLAEFVSVRVTCSVRWCGGEFKCDLLLEVEFLEVFFSTMMMIGGMKDENG